MTNNLHGILHLWCRRKIYLIAWWLECRAWHDRTFTLKWSDLILRSSIELAVTMYWLYYRTCGLFTENTPFTEKSSSSAKKIKCWLWSVDANTIILRPYIHVGLSLYRVLQFFKEENIRYLCISWWRNEKFVSCHKHNIFRYMHYYYIAFFIFL